MTKTKKISTQGHAQPDEVLSSQDAIELSRWSRIIGGALTLAFRVLNLVRRV